VAADGGRPRNAFFFHQSSRRELGQALAAALAHLARMTPAEREAYVRALSAEAHGLRWDRPGGPLAQYDHVYRIAVASL
jgi:hypothetical protein